ncbi:putative MFS-type transporter YfcJ [Methylobacterium crusticola]|uniref:Uncharacterized MFS-type transporter OPKNFCMD_6113 n=2 Tax=Methylobacterium crusticola TaxID=1697972 RepID=A0ABQ4R6N8_9HYPH|nr:putative MFS-type transporter YfcJ [Methylobacterium crusticola]
MSDLAHRTGAAAPPPLGAAAGLAPLVLIVFLGFLAVGAPLPALALYVHDELGFGGAVVGWSIGLQSLAAVLTRHRAGTISDASGPRRAVLLGLPLAALSGLLYLASAWAPLAPGGRLGLLILGRLILGLGESLFLTGTMSWGIARLDASRTGKVMSWQGIAMYAAIGLGAPLGLAVHAAAGFAGVAALAAGAPLLAVAVALALPGVPASGGGERVGVGRVLGLIWRPGLVLALATVPFAAMAAFLVLDYADHGWSGAGLGLAGFGAGYILVRLLGSHLPDRLGGARIAAASLGVEVLGQLLLWLAPGPGLAAAGATVTGLGFSLVFPAMGVEATRRVPPELRGRAVGGFIAFFDVAMGLTGPAVGLVAGRFGFASAFLVGAVATLAALALLTARRRAGTAA